MDHTDTVVDAPTEEEHDDVVDAEVVHDQPASQKAELVQRPEGSTALIAAESPDDLVERAAAIATSLDRVVKAQGMRTKVGSQKKLDPETGEPVKEGGRDVWVPRWHVNVEAWQTLATLLGLAIVPVWTRRVIDPQTGQPEKVTFDVHEKTWHSKSQGGGLKAERTYTVEGFSWEARVEVYKDGTIVGAGEAMCGRTEQRWKDADDYAVRAMATTRATSRAVAAAARWIVTLAGYNATPAEEIPDDAKGEQAPAPAARPLGEPADETSEPRAVSALELLIETVDDKGDAPTEYARAVVAEIKRDAGGYLPRASVRALLFAAAQLRRRLDAVAEKAAQDGDAETAPATPAAGTVEKPAGQTEQAYRDAGCTCVGPLEPDDKTEAHDDACPIKGHGIPF